MELREKIFFFTEALQIATETQINEGNAKIVTQPVVAELK